LKENFEIPKKKQLVLIKKHFYYCMYPDRKKTGRKKILEICQSKLKERKREREREMPVEIN
jgi:hypothetical protein